MAPELFEQRDDGLPVRPSKQSDIYSFGGIVLLVRLGDLSSFKFLIWSLGSYQQVSLLLYRKSASCLQERNELCQACKSSLRSGL
jgi:hypothetical protein